MITLRKLIMLPHSKKWMNLVERQMLCPCIQWTCIIKCLSVFAGSTPNKHKILPGNFNPYHLRTRTFVHTGVSQNRGTPNSSKINHFYIAINPLICGVPFGLRNPHLRMRLRLGLCITTLVPRSRTGGVEQDLWILRTVRSAGLLGRGLLPEGLMVSDGH